MNTPRHGLIILALQISGCLSIATYEIFKGFDKDPFEPDDPTRAESSVIQDLNNQTDTINKTLSLLSLDFSDKFINITLPPENTTSTEPPMNTTTKRTKVVCPEEERPANIGPYEVPTQRDLALLIKNTLVKMFKSYHQKAMFFLNDIKKATRATMAVERTCLYNKLQYKQCVRHVSNQCEAITKGLVITLEQQRHEITVFSESSACNVTGLSEDPVKLIQRLAIEEASIEFALPAFLRLLNSCANFCIAKPHVRASKPPRHMTDAGLVVQHLLTKKSYKDLIQT